MNAGSGGMPVALIVRAMHGALGASLGDGGHALSVGRQMVAVFGWRPPAVRATSAPP